MTDAVKILEFKMQSSQRDTQKLLNDLRTVKKEVAALGDTSSTRSSFTELGKAAQQGATRAAEGFEAAKSELLDLEDATEKATEATKKFNNERERTGRTGATSSGGSELNFGTIGTSLTGLGLGDAGGIATSVDDFRNLVSQVTAGGPAALAMAAGVGAVTLGIVELNRHVTDATSGLRDITNREREYYELRVAGTTDSIEAAIKAAELDQKIAQARFDDVKYVAEGYDILHEKLGVLSGPIDAIVEAAGALGGTNFKDIRDARLAYDEANAALTKANDKVELYSGLLDDSNRATNDAAEAQKRLNEEHDRAVEAAQRNLTAIEAQIDALNAQNKLTNDTTTADRLTRDQREQEDFEDQREAATTAHLDRLVALETQGNARIEQLREQGQKRLAQADNGIRKLRLGLLDVDEKLAKDRSKAEQEYMASEHKAVVKFYEDERKFTEQANTARLRRLQDLSNELQDAEEANDVVRFIQAKRRGEQDLQRLAEDTDSAAQERQRQFQAERDEAQQRFAERLTQLREEADARKADIQEQIAERQQARVELEAELKAQIDTQRAQNEATLKAQQDAFDAQIEREDATRKKRQERQAEDDRIADQRRKAALDAQLADLNTKANAERQIIQGTGETLRQVFIGVLNSLSAAARNFGGSSSSLTGIGSSSNRSGPGRAFGEGGIITSPTVALRGEKPGVYEAEIPFRPSEGIGPALSRLGLGGDMRPVMNFNAPISIGDGISASEFYAGMEKMGMAIVKANANARQGVN